MKKKQWFSKKQKLNKRIQIYQNQLIVVQKNPLPARPP